MYKYRFTIFTPTYNRAYMLGNLYEGLKNQTFKDFEWLIVDDGSTDDTKELVEKFKSENKIDINYIHKENGGKHTANNIGTENAKGELFFVVDSDDNILENALEEVDKSWKLVNDKDVCVGVVGLDQYPDGRIIGKKFEKEMEIPFTDIYEKYKVVGDKAIAIKTSVMKEYKFPEDKNINFVTESVVWDDIAKKYNVRCTNNILKVTEYLEDGLTNNKLSENYINGMAFSSLYCINKNIYTLNHYPVILLRQYINVYKFSKVSNINYAKKFNKLYKKVIYILLKPLSYIYYKKLVK